MRASCSPGVMVGAGLALTLISIAPAQAQEMSFDEQAVSPANFKRDRNVSVVTRPRPEYSSEPYRVGAFLVTPQAVVDVEHDDNIRASETGQVDDIIFRLRPQLTARSNWSRHLLTATLRADSRNFADFSKENTLDASLGLAARYDVSRASALQVGGAIGRDHIDRASPNSLEAAVEPVEFDFANVYFGATQAFNRLRLSAAADIGEREHRDSVSTSGVRIDENLRDRRIVSGLVNAEYAVSPAMSVYVRAVAEDRNFTSPGTLQVPRDAEGYEITLGTSFEITTLVRGNFRVGYLEHDYEQSFYKDIEGLQVAGRLEYFFTPLLTFSLNANRSVEDAVIAGASGYLDTSVAFRGDYELLRNLVITAQVTYENSDFSGIDREDKRWGGGLAAEYLVNRQWALRTSYEYRDQGSSGVNSGRDYDANVFSVGIVYRGY